MKLKPLVLAMSLTATSATAVAVEPATKEEKRGAISGMVIGAIVGGMPGATLGALAGGELFGRYFALKRKHGELQSELKTVKTDHKQERIKLDGSIDALNRDLDKLIALRAATPKTQVLPIQFRTGSSDIEHHYEKELSVIARLLKRNQDASVTLTGFADRRGDDAFNQTLSEKRAGTVKQYLVSHGVKPRQVATIAYGETKPVSQEESFETNFFDRRVMVELTFDLDPQLATR